MNESVILLGPLKMGTPNAETFKAQLVDFFDSRLAWRFSLGPWALVFGYGHGTNSGVRVLGLSLEGFPCKHPGRGWAFGCFPQHRGPTPKTGYCPLVEIAPKRSGAREK